MSAIVAADDPYRLGLETMGAALEAGTPTPSPQTHGVYLIWGSLTDGVELHPDEAKHYTNLMRQAANEWSSINTEEDRAVWIDHWVYDVCGYARTD